MAIKPTYRAVRRDLFALAIIARAAREIRLRPRQWCQQEITARLMGDDEMKKSTPRGPGPFYAHYAPLPLDHPALLYIMTHYHALGCGSVNRLRRMVFPCEL